MSEIGIVETKNIIKAINDNYSIDFADYALTSFKRRLERIMDINNFRHLDQLMNRIQDDKVFMDAFLHDISVPSTEMFRDPSLWRILREETIPLLIKENSHPLKIWFPNSVSGDEVYSMAIILSEMGILEKTQLIVSSLSDKSIEYIKSGNINQSKLEISTDNYIRANGTKNFADYFIDNDKIAIRNKELIQNVTFIKQNIYLETIPQNIKLILYRNKMIYYNQVLQWKVLKNISEAIVNNGVLIIGTKESLGNIYGNTDFSLISSTESIYRKR